MLAELRAVQTAQRALARHDGPAALRALASLDRAQPQGNLREERDALRVLALCEAGRADDARAAADVFLTRHPGSPQAARVRGACR
jgi:outer membrane protein assembly factor BamD (BamD/ComL family)